MEYQLLKKRNTSDKPLQAFHTLEAAHAYALTQGWVFTHMNEQTGQRTYEAVEPRHGEIAIYIIRPIHTT